MASRNAAVSRAERPAMPQSLGWLRRPELDVPGGGEAWELPDGEIRITDPPETDGLPPP